MSFNFQMYKKLVIPPGSKNGSLGDHVPYLYRNSNVGQQHDHQRDGEQNKEHVHLVCYLKATWQELLDTPVGRALLVTHFSQLLQRNIISLFIVTLFPKQPFFIAYKYCLQDNSVYNGHHFTPLIPDIRLLTWTNTVGKAMMKDAIQIRMVTILAWFMVHTDRALKGYRMATNLW